MSDIEAEVRAAHDAGDMERAATLAMRGYGPELLGFLVATIGDHGRASDAFGQLGEDLWRGLPGFNWRSSLRTWAYTLARNAAHRLRAEAWQRKGRRLATHELARVEEDVRETTLRHLRTTSKGQVAALRAELDPDERELLVLRVDRRLEWPEVAIIVFGEMDAAQARKRAATLRKRFERVTERLRERARAAGLLES